MTTGDTVLWGKTGRMRVTYTGDSGAVKTTAGNDAKLKGGAEYECQEKEYHSGLFVRMTIESGEKVKVKRSDLKKVT